MPTRPVSNSEPVQEVELFECYDCSEEFTEDELNPSPHNEQVCENCEMDNYFWCESCGNGDYMDYCCWSDYHEATYCESCYPDNGEDVDLESFSSSVETPELDGNTFLKNKFDRMVGLEIETISPDESDGNHPSTFTKMTDGSIESEGDWGYEYVSKPMNGDHLFWEIDRMNGYLRSREYRVNRSCGLHIHIDARDLYWKELRGIMLVTKSFEKTIKSMMPNSRSDVNWCKSLPMDKVNIQRISSDSDFIQTWYDNCNEPPSMDKYNDSRYHGLNLHARVYLGTIEFRYHSGTINSTKIKNWITICQSIIQRGILLGKQIDNTLSQEEYSDNEIRELIFSEDDLGLEKFIKYLKLEDIKNYIIRRIFKFNRPVYDTDRVYINNNI